MPLYEYCCAGCGHAFETLVRGASDVPRCPECGGLDLAKQFSVPAAAQTGPSRSSLPICDSGAGPAPFGGCGRPECGSGACAFDD